MKTLRDNLERQERVYRVKAVMTTVADRRFQFNSETRGTFASAIAKLEPFADATIRVAKHNADMITSLQAFQITELPTPVWTNVGAFPYAAAVVNKFRERLLSPALVIVAFFAPGWVARLMRFDPPRCRSHKAGATRGAAKRDRTQMRCEERHNGAEKPAWNHLGWWLAMMNQSRGSAANFWRTGAWQPEFKPHHGAPSMRVRRGKH